MDIQDIDNQVQQDVRCQAIIRELLVNSTSHPGFSLLQGHLFYKNRLVLPSSSPFISTILQEGHASPMGGHSGVLKTLKKISVSFYWEGMKGAIQHFVAHCDICQKNKYFNLALGSLLQPLPIPKQIWDDISMDFIEGLPLSKGVDSILVVVDRLSKYGHFIGLRHPFSAHSVASIFVREVVRLHGFPNSIVSDQDKIFMSHFWQSLFRHQGTTLKMSTTYHPQINGQTEVVNCCIETYLRCFARSKPRSWAKFLPWAEYWYNTSFHSATHTTTFRVVYGRDPPKLIKGLPNSVLNSEVDKMRHDCDAILALLCEQLV